MQRHKLDGVSLIFGLAFLVAGGMYLIATISGGTVSRDLILPATLGVVGIGAIAVGVLRTIRPEATTRDPAQGEIR